MRKIFTPLSMLPVSSVLTRTYLLTIGYVNSIESFMYDSISLPVDWIEVTEVHKRNKWPLFVSLSMDRIEKERLHIPVEAFQFWEQKDFNTMLKEIMDKSAFYKFKPEEERMQGIAYLLIEMFKLRRSINTLNMHPEIADEYFQVKWKKPVTGYQIINRLQIKMFWYQENV